MRGIFANHPLPWSVTSDDGRAIICDTSGGQVPLQSGSVQQASLIASLANTLQATTDALLAAEYAFIWMESNGCVIEDGGTDAVLKVSSVLEDMREGGLV